MKDDIIYNIKNKIKKKNKFIKNLLNINNDYIINFIKSNDNKLLGLYNNNNKLLLAGKYNFFGIYQQQTNLWVWASSIPGIDRHFINYITKLKSFNYLFETNNDDKSNFYYQLLTQDVILIKDETKLQWINELLLYLSDDLFYFNPRNSDLNIQFLTLINIKEKYFE